MPAPVRTTMFLYLLHEIRSATLFIASGGSSNVGFEPMDTFTSPSDRDVMSSSTFTPGRSFSLFASFPLGDALSEFIAILRLGNADCTNLVTGFCSLGHWKLFTYV